MIIVKEENNTWNKHNQDADDDDDEGEKRNRERDTSARYFVVLLFSSRDALFWQAGRYLLEIEPCNQIVFHSG